MTTAIRIIIEQVEDEQTTYTALNMLGKEESDDQLYTHLNNAQQDTSI